MNVKYFQNRRIGITRSTVIFDISVYKFKLKFTIISRATGFFESCNHFITPILLEISSIDKRVHHVYIMCRAVNLYKFNSIQPVSFRNELFAGIAREKGQRKGAKHYMYINLDADDHQHGRNGV